MDGPGKGNRVRPEAISTYDLGIQLIRMVDSAREFDQAYPDTDKSGVYASERAIAELGTMFSTRRKLRHVATDQDVLRPLPAPKWAVGVSGPWR